MKRISLFLVTLLIVGSAAIAQNISREARLSARERADQMTEKMHKNLSLTESQRERMLELNRETANRWGDDYNFPGERPLWDKNLSEAEKERKLNEMKAEHDRYDQEVKNILNDDQYNAFVNNRTEKQQRMMDRNKQRTRQ